MKTALKYAAKFAVSYPFYLVCVYLWPGRWYCKFYLWMLSIAGFAAFVDYDTYKFATEGE